jgi:capsular exopolysaccharide synthesis family protein
MSKYFDETQSQMEQTVLEQLDAGSFQQLLDGIKSVGRPAAQAAESRLEEYRSLKLTTQSQPLLISRLNEFNHEAAESYRALRTRLTRLQSLNGFRSLVVTSAVQGDGKTLTSANLAISFAQLPNMRTLLVDSDLRSGGLSKLLGAKAGPGLSEILHGKTSYASAICSTDLPNLHVLGVGAGTASPLELLAGASFKEFISWASACFGIIIIDSPPLISVSDCELITSVCDATLMVVRALHTQRELLESAVSQVDPKKLVGYVYNDAEEKTKYGSYRDYPQSR